MRRAVLAVVLAAVAAGPAGAAPRGSLGLVFSADRSPAVSNEIYRLPIGGRAADLSRSPFADLAPAVSPDGRRVAFLSGRGGAWRLWLVRPDGTGLRAASSSLPYGGGRAALAWSPDGRRVAVVVGGASGAALIVAGAGLATHTISRSGDLFDPGWSPDGSEVTVVDGGGVDAYTPSGRHLWNASSGGLAVAGWSRSGVFVAGPIAGSISAYDVHGRRLFTVSADSAAWSPGGTRLAVARRHRIAVLSSQGRALFAKVVPTLVFDAVTWASNDEVLGYRTGTGAPVTIDVGTGRVASFAGLPFLVAKSSDGKLAATAVQDGDTFDLVVQGASRRQVAGTVPGCWDDGVLIPALTALQFTPDDRSLVYQSLCSEPFANLWATSASGGGLRRLTSVAEEETQPALSPDGSRIAFTWSSHTGLSCKGCAQDLYVANADGSSATALTSGIDGQFDTNPTWSPDGRTILYQHATVDSSDLYELPATGGAPTALHIGSSAWWPTWGPTRIAYVNESVDPAEVWTALPDGSDRRRVAHGNITGLAWSSDGRLAWLESSANGATWWLVVHGSSTTRVRIPFVSARSLAWSPDGSRIAVVARAKSTASSDVYTLTPAGTVVRRITHDLDALDVTWR